MHVLTLFACLPKAYAKGENPDDVAGEFGRRPLYKMLGYFSLVGLLRLHSLLGDFYQAVKVLENMELNKKVNPLLNDQAGLKQLFNLFRFVKRLCTRVFLPAKYLHTTTLASLT